MNQWGLYVFSPCIALALFLYESPWPHASICTLALCESKPVVPRTPFTMPTILEKIGQGDNWRALTIAFPDHSGLHRDRAEMAQ